MFVANLKEANLEAASLEGANLNYAGLEGANLREANLDGVDLRLCCFEENTILPDGSKWTRDTAMTRFSDPEHPDFWRSDDKRSPAYRDKDTSE